VAYVEMDFGKYGKVVIKVDGKEAPITAKNFLDLVYSEFYDGLTIFRAQRNFVIQGGEDKNITLKPIKGEFQSNGIKNKVPMEKGTIVMARGENYDSAYGQFFILTEDEPELEGEYAAFGKITDLEVLEKILKDLQVSEHGIARNAPKILTISLHDAHH
jgi:peptidyl-prolyl cis-trans isomerase B (cyclophilin B)